MKKIVGILKNFIFDSEKEITKSDNIKILDFISCNNKDSKDNNEKKIEKKNFNFYELIKSQDIFEGNWINNNGVKILIEEEKKSMKK